MDPTNDSLQSHIATLTTERDMALAERDQIADSYMATQKTLTVVLGSRERWRGMHAALQTEYTALKSEQEAEAVRTEARISGGVQMQAVNENLRQQVEIAQVQRDSMMDENKQLRDQIKKLEAAAKISVPEMPILTATEAKTNVSEVVAKRGPGRPPKNPTPAAQ